MTKRTDRAEANSSGNDGISRRDFLNGVLLAAGGAALTSFTPMRTFGRPPSSSGEIGIGACDGGIGMDPRVLRGGNIPSVFNVGHWMRDDRLTFSANSVKLAPSKCDDSQGNFPIIADNGNYDVIIAGSGMSGLSAAFFLTRRRPGTRVLILDANPTFGGNANRDDAPPIPDIASTATAYAVPPYNDFLTEIYTTIGVDWAANYVASPFYCYFFDNNTPYVNPGTNSWTLDVYGAGVKDMPYAPKIIQDLQQAKQDFQNWGTKAGAPTDPADTGDPKYYYLSTMSLDQYLTQVRKFHPAVSDFYTRYAIDALTGTSAQVSAYSSISFLGAEYRPEFAYPGGNSGIARHILHFLIPGAIQGSTSAEIIANPVNTSQLDNPNNNVRVRQSCMVLRADTNSQNGSVVYYTNGNFYRATAKAVILAGQSHTAQHIIQDLIDPTRQAAFDQYVLAPTITANVTLRTAASLTQLGLGYDQYWWGSTYWADFVIADWIDPTRRNNPNRQTVLTFYGGNTLPPDQMPQARVDLLNTPFGAYEQSLRDDLNRILAGGGFDFNRDVSAIYLYRWGHGLVYPYPGFIFGNPIDPTNCPRHIARQQLGRISFAGQDTESTPANESAIGSGLRTCNEVLPLLG